MARLISLALMSLLVCACAPSTPTLRLSDGTRYAYEVDRPARARGAGVLLLGGGYGHDSDWSVPGSVEHEGETVRLTLSGETHADAPAIARALTARGFVVVRTGTVPAGADGASMVPFQTNLEIAERGLRTLRAQPEVQRVYLVGHSLGATRAALIADEEVGGIVALAGAYLSRAGESVRTLSERALASEDAMARAVDLDGDGAIRGWEAAAATLVEAEGDEYFQGHPWPIERLRELGVPVLAIFGGLDPISLHGPSLDRLPGATVVYMKNLGHNLGPESDEGPWGRVGPMAPGVVEELAGWLEGVDAGARGGG